MKHAGIRFFNSGGEEASGVSVISLCQAMNGADVLAHKNEIKQGASSGRSGHLLRRPGENVAAAGIRPSPGAAIMGGCSNSSADG